MNTTERSSSMSENGIEKRYAEESKGGPVVDRVESVDVINYHGLTARTVLVYLALSLLLAGQSMNVIGSGVFARDVASVVGGSSKSIWLNTSIGILTCVLGPPVAQAADYWGRKWFIVILTACGFIGCMVVARANSMEMAIAGEVIAGVSFGSQPLLYAVASEILPRQWRPEAQAGLNVAIGLAGIFTALVGLKLTDNNPAGFRTFFYITAGLHAFAAIITAILYNPPLRPLQVSLSFKEKVAKLDWSGYALLASGTVLFIIALAWSRNPYSWTDAHILGPFIIGSVLLICFAIHQWKFRSDGMFNHDLFRKDRNFTISLISLFVEGAVFFAANNFFIFELSILFEANTYLTGVRFCIAFITAMAVSPAVGLYCSRAKKLRVPTTLAFVSFLIFNILMATATLSSGKAMWAYPIFLGIGLGVCLTCLVTAAQLSAPPSLISISSGLLTSVRSLGGSVGLAIYNAIFNSKISSSLGPNIAAAVLPLGLSPANLPAFISALANNQPTELVKVPGVTPQMIGAGVHALKVSYLESFRYVWVAAGAISAVATISAVFLVNPKRDFNMHVDAPLEEHKE